MDSTLCVISVATGQVTTTHPSFIGLGAVAVNPNGKAVYVTDNESVHVITLVTQVAKITSKAASTFTVSKKGTFELVLEK